MLKHTIKLLVVTAEPPQVSAWLTISVKVKPDFNLALIVRSNLVDLLSVAIPKGYELKEIAELFLKALAHLPSVAIKTKRLIAKAGELITDRVTLHSRLKAPSCAEEGLA